MHASVDEWVGGVVAHEGLAGRHTLEVGSYDVNGSVRHHFQGCYTGLDIVPGPGVDVVYDGLSIPFDRGTFPVVVSTEMLEHCRSFWQVCAEMVRVLAYQGTLIVTARGNTFALHNEPDRWRFMPGALSEVFEDLGLDDIEELPDTLAPGVFVVAHRGHHA